MVVDIDTLHCLFDPSDNAKKSMTELGIQPVVTIPHVEEMFSDDGSGCIGYIAKGHVSLEEFQAGVHWLGHEEVEIDSGKLQHTMARKVPVPPGGDFYMYYQIPAKAGPGAYKATVYYLE